MSSSVDGHDDLPMLVRMAFGNRIYGDNFTSPFAKGKLVGHVDLPRLQKGKVGGTFWSVFVECPADNMNFSDENYAASMYRYIQWGWEPRGNCGSRFINSFSQA